MLSRLITRKEQLILAGVAVAVVCGAVSLYWHDRAEKQKAEASTTFPLPTAAIPRAPVPAPPSATTLEPRVQAALPEAPPSAAPELAVSVAGAVERPGMYRVPSDARVQDAIEAAGGANEQSDLSDLNLAARVLDGTTLTVPVQATARAEGNRLVARGGMSAADLNPAGYTISGAQTASSYPVASKSSSAEPAPDSSVPEKPAKSGSQGGKIDLNTATNNELETLPGVGPKLAQAIIAYRSATPFTSVEDLGNVRGFGQKRLEAIRSLVCVK